MKRRLADAAIVAATTWRMVSLHLGYQCRNVETGFSMNNDAVDNGEHAAARTLQSESAIVGLVQQETVVLLVDLVESVRLMREQEATTVRR
jgi:hypothetical protein